MDLVATTAESKIPRLLMRQDFATVAAQGQNARS